MVDLPTVIASLAALNILAPPASALLIDSFTAAPTHLAAIGVTQTDTAAGLDPAAVLGGSRHLSVRSLSGAVGNAEVEIGDGQFRFTNASGTLSYFTLAYGDYTFNASVPPLNLDLTADGADRFVIDVVGYTPGGGLGDGTRVVLWVRVPAATGTIYRSAPLNNLGPGRYFVRFADIPGLDPTDVAGLGFETGRAPVGREFIISRFATVPEPAAGALGFAAMLVANALQRRRTMLNRSAPS